MSRFLRKINYRTDCSPPPPLRFQWARAPTIFFFARPKTNSIFFSYPLLFLLITLICQRRRRRIAASVFIYLHFVVYIIVSQRSPRGFNRRPDSNPSGGFLTAARAKTMPNACLRGLRDRAFSLFLIPRECACKQHVLRPIIILYSSTVITITCNDNNTRAIYIYLLRQW